MYKHILIATDGSGLAEKAVIAGLALAKGIGAKVTAVTVCGLLRPRATARLVPFDAYEKAAGEAASKILASVSELAKQLDAECATVHVKENPADGILLVAKNRGCDLIVMASHGRRGLSRLFSAAKLHVS